MSSTRVSAVALSTALINGLHSMRLESDWRGSRRRRNDVLLLLLAVTK